MTLKDETIEFLCDFEKKPCDVLWVGSDDGHFAITWAAFEVLADREYYPIWVAYDLVVVGEGWWIERRCEGDDEWWEYKELPKRVDAKVFLEVFGNGPLDLLNG